VTGRLRTVERACPQVALMITPLATPARLVPDHVPQAVSDQITRQGVIYSRIA
jgi:hypothetical protein